MLSHRPFTEETAPETIFNQTAQAFRQRDQDYLGIDVGCTHPYIQTADFRFVVVDEEDETQTPLQIPTPTDLLKIFSTLKSPTPFSEDFQIRFGYDYDFGEDDPRYGSTGLFRHFIEFTMSMPIAFNSVKPDERAKAIGTLVLEYPTEMTEILGEMGIETANEEVYEIGRKYRKEASTACTNLMRTADEPVELREVQTLSFELSERERVIRRMFTRSFESGDTLTVLSSITSDGEGKICEEDSAIPFEMTQDPEINAHDQDLGDLFSEILSGSFGLEAPTMDQTYQYASEIWALLQMSYTPYRHLVANT